MDGKRRVVKGRWRLVLGILSIYSIFVVLVDSFSFHKNRLRWLGCHFTWTCGSTQSHQLIHYGGSPEGQLNGTICVF